MCDQKRSAISILIPIALSVGVAAIVGSCVWTYENDDMQPGHNYPYISDCGNQLPQQALFATSFAVVAAFMALVTFVRFMQFNAAFGASLSLRALNETMLVLAMIAFFSMIGLAAFNDLDFQLVHNIFAVACFGCLFVYQVCHTGFLMRTHELRGPIRAYQHNGYEEPVNVTGSTEIFQQSNLAMIIYYLLVNATSICALVLAASHYLPYDAGLPQVAESVLVFSSMIYYIPWVWEMQNCTIENLERQGFKRNEEAKVLEETEFSVSR